MYYCYRLKCLTADVDLIRFSTRDLPVGTSINIDGDLFVVQTRSLLPDGFHWKDLEEV